MKKKILSPMLCLIAAIVWGFAFSFQEIASNSSDMIDAFFFGGIRFAVGATSLIPLILIFEKEKDLPREEKKIKTKKTVIYGVITGTILFAASTLQQFGIQITQASGKAGFITGMYLIFVPIASFILFKQKASPVVWGAALIALGGLYFLCMGGTGFTVSVGDILLLLGSFCFTAHIIVIDKFINRVSALKYSAVQFYTVALFNIITGLFVGHVTWEGIVTTIIPILYCGIGSTGIAYTCQILGQKLTPPTVAALLFSTESLFSVVAECIFKKQLPTTTMLIGCTLMFIGIILSQLPIEFKKIDGKLKIHLAKDENAEIN
ncbi:MAG: DMT family transporter [Clostridia bacterium]|nr:DMT family transporter [Clostridia bacterium]